MMLSGCSTVPVAVPPPKAEFNPFPAEVMVKCQDSFNPLPSGLTWGQLAQDDAQAVGAAINCATIHNSLVDQITKRVNAN